MRVAAKFLDGRSSRIGRLSVLTFSSFALIALGACGSSSKTGTSSSPTTPTSQSAPSNAKTTVLMTGSRLTDANGRTLYTLTNAGKPVACTGQCATFWPPLLLASGSTTPTGASGVNGLSVVSMNGGMQVTVNGVPLYRFSRDKAPGDTNGEGIQSFGGIWHVAHPMTASSGPANTTAPPVTSGNGSGY